MVSLFNGLTALENFSLLLLVRFHLKWVLKYNIYYQINWRVFRFFFPKSVCMQWIATISIPPWLKSCSYLFILCFMQQVAFFFFLNLLHFTLCHFCICLSLCSCFFSPSGIRSFTVCVFDWLLVFPMTLSFFFCPPPRRRLSEKEIQFECVFDGEMGSVVYVHLSFFVSLSLSPRVISSLWLCSSS